MKERYDDSTLISVIVPVYNAKNYIERCIDSIIRQKNVNLEIIIIDDGSEDESYTICKRIARCDKRIVIIRFENNKGVVEARNAGIEYANGEYITFVDADDCLIYDNYYHDVLRESESADIVFTDYIDSKQSTFRQPLEKKVFREASMSAIYNNLFFNGENSISANIWDKFFKKRVLKNNYLKIDSEIYYGEDKCLLVACVIDSNSISNTQICGYRYTIRDDSIVHSRHDDFLINLGRWYCQLKKLILEDGRNVTLLKNGLERELTINLTRTAPKVLGLEDKNRLALWHFPFFGRLKGKKIILWGAGDVGQAYRFHIVCDKEGELVLWVDTEWMTYRKLGYDVHDWREIKGNQFDCIVLAVRTLETVEEIKEQLKTIDVDCNLIEWSPTGWI